MLDSQSETEGLPASDDILALTQALTDLRADIVEDVGAQKSRLEEVHPNYRKSAQNLLHYLALRRHDLRPLQRRLAILGLSSLGRAESHVLATLDAVLQVLHRVSGRTWQPPDETGIGFEEGDRLLQAHSDDLLGPEPGGRDVRIMVTMPGEAAEDYALVRDLVANGMDCMRINCAHDDRIIWLRIIEHLRRAQRELGKPCRIAMDLGGPKLRTGPLEPGPCVVRIHPRRNEFGRVVTPARVWLTAAEHPLPAPSAAAAVLPVPAAWLAGLQPDDSVTFTDVRDADRDFTIVEETDSGVWAEASRTAYVVPGTALRHQHDRADAGSAEATVGEIAPMENAILLKPGDQLLLTRGLQPGHPAVKDSGGETSPAAIGCTIPEVFEDVREGESIWFDDGKIGGVIERIEPDHAVVRITQTGPGGAKLRADKGINLPDSNLRLPALTQTDLDDLAFVSQHADIVELSFANTASDVASLQRCLNDLGDHPPAIVMKIETKRGFENLPGMLLTAMRSPCCGVMIARGDLAVESGFERLAELQEEILWICEAAHVPVIWATQVLESLAQQGMPSRAEITDAAMGHRAECVMLNKGPHILSAVRALDDILRRMQSHQTKKQSMLRELRLAHTLPIDSGAPSPAGTESL